MTAQSRQAFTAIAREKGLGLQDFTMAEIISGVEAGETVSTGIIQTQ